MSLTVDNSVSIVGQYIKVKRLGKEDVYFAKKNTTMNVSNQILTLKESNDGGQINILKTDVDAEKWGSGVFFTWTSIISYFAENTANYQ